MRREVIQFMALIALLAQGVLGSVAPVAVLCLHNGSCESSIEIEVPPTSCDHKSCCRSHIESENPAARPMVAIASPCDEGCQSCVDIGLPDLDFATLDRADGHTGDLGPDLTPLVVAIVHIEHATDRPLPPATGPPDLVACLHAPILRSTRLLI